jgi:hypothetical protein
MALNRGVSAGCEGVSREPDARGCASGLEDFNDIEAHRALFHSMADGIECGRSKNSGLLAVRDGLHGLTMPQVCSQLHLREDQAVTLFTDNVYLAAAAPPVALQYPKAQALQVGGSIPLSGKSTGLRWTSTSGPGRLAPRVTHSPIANCAQVVAASPSRLSRLQKLNR